MKRIAYITDIHLNEDLDEKHQVDCNHQWELILQDVIARGINQIVFGGDIGAASAYPWFFETLKSYAIDFVLGNHDTPADAIPYYKGIVLTNPTELYCHSTNQRTPPKGWKLFKKDFGKLNNN
jgi:Icc protein